MKVGSLVRQNFADGTNQVGIVVATEGDGRWSYVQWKHGTHSILSKVLEVISEAR